MRAPSCLVGLKEPIQALSIEHLSQIRGSKKGGSPEVYQDDSHVQVLPPSVHETNKNRWWHLLVCTTEFMTFSYLRESDREASDHDYVFRLPFFLHLCLCQVLLNLTHCTILLHMRYMARQMLSQHSRYHRCTAVYSEYSNHEIGISNFGRGGGELIVAIVPPFKIKNHAGWMLHTIASREETLGLHVCTSLCCCLRL